MVIKNIEQLCQKIEQLCDQNQYSKARQLWQITKPFSVYYHFVEPDFQFKKAKIIDRDIDLSEPSLIQLNQKHPLKFNQLKIN